MFLPTWVIGSCLAAAVFVFVIMARVLVRVRRGATTFRAVAEGSSDGLVLMEQDSRIIWANDAYCRIMGRALEDILGCYPLEFALPPHLAMTREEARAFRFDPAEERFGKLTQVENMRGNGEYFVHEFSHAVVRTGKHRRFLLAGRDVTERMEREKELILAQDKLKLLSHQDSLTGLSNRHCHAQEIASLVAKGAPFAVLQIDMNDFKLINDTYGHAAGDAFLVHFSEVLAAIAEDDWHCARVGGDEFTILIPGVWALGVALACASRIFNQSQVPMKWRAGALRPTISVGAAVYNGQEQSGEDILARADVALYAAKAMTGERVAGYDDDMHHAHQARQAVLDEFSQALSDGGIGLELTPVVEADGGALLRFEVDPAWHPRGRHNVERSVLWRLAGQLCQTDALERQMVQRAAECLSRNAPRGAFSHRRGAAVARGLVARRRDG